MTKTLVGLTEIEKVYGFEKQKASAMKGILERTAGYVRTLKSSMAEIEEVYGLQNDPLYQNVDKDLEDISLGLKKSLTAVNQKKPEPRSPYDFRRGDLVEHIKSKRRSTVLYVTGMDVWVGWVDRRNEVIGASFPLMSFRRIDS